MCGIWAWYVYPYVVYPVISLIANSLPKARLLQLLLYYNESPWVIWSLREISESVGGI